MRMQVSLIKILRYKRRVICGRDSQPILKILRHMDIHRFSGTVPGIEGIIIVTRTLHVYEAPKEDHVSVQKNSGLKFGL